MVWKLNHGLAPIRFSPANHALPALHDCTVHIDAMVS
jgi:hypothetical protein